MHKPPRQSIAYLTTFPPRECGIANFCFDLISALDKSYSRVLDAKIIAINPEPEQKFKYSKKVIFQINQNSISDYRLAAKLINASPDISLVVIQHEFGIFGGNYGSFLLDFLEELKKPSIIIFHTILPGPKPLRLETVKNLAAKTSQIVVMTNLSKQILREQYQIPEEKITIIPHGIHPVVFTSGENAKHKLKIIQSPVISTFGLISRGKGLEYILDALPAVIKKYPNLLYLIIGKTHPSVVKEEGESYRKLLENKVQSLRLTNNVKFINQYLKLPTLLNYLLATDIYIASSLDSNQAVSGTFSYAAGAGRPIIATAFAQARAELEPGMGILVDFKNPGAYADAILNLLDNPEKLRQMGKNCYFKTRKIIWPNIAIAYAKLFAQFLPALDDSQIHLPSIKLDHLAKLTDDFGIFQFAELDTPNPVFGYTLDDNARALLVAIAYFEKTKAAQALKLTKIYLNFFEHTFLPNNHFQNYFNRDRLPNDEANQLDNLEETNARALNALVQTMLSEFLPREMRNKAKSLYKKRISAGTDFTYPRSMAIYLEALYSLSKSPDNADILKEVDFYCKKLLALFKKNSSGDWQWFEKNLTYSNSALSKALLLGFAVTKNPEYFQVGKTSLDFLIRHTFIKNVYMPIGQNGWYKQSGERAFFDQQPEDVAAMVRALQFMYFLTKDDYYKKLMHKAFNWFLGENILGQFVYDATSGGCYDGLGEKNINLNQGAESTILYLLARLSLDSIPEIEEQKPQT